LGPRGGYEFALEHFTTQLRLGYCQSGFSNEHLATDANELDAEAALLRVVDIGAFSLGGGASVGAAWLRQTFDGARVAPARDTLALEFSALAQGTFELDAGLFFGLEAAGFMHVFEQQNGRPPRTDATTEFTVRSTLFAGKHF
jgi:hypothetical protein